MRLAFAFLISIAASAGVRDVDWKNRFFQTPPDDQAFWGEGANPPKGFQLKKGLVRFTEEDRWSRIELGKVVFGDLDGDSIEDAAMNIYAKSWGTQSLSLVYVYSGAALKLMKVIETGERANYGLYGISIVGQRLVLDLADPEFAYGLCCSTRFLRQPHQWNGKNFKAMGPVWRHMIELHISHDEEALKSIATSSPAYVEAREEKACPIVRFLDSDVNEPLTRAYFQLRDLCPRFGIEVLGNYYVELKTGRVFDKDKKMEMKSTALEALRKRIFAPERIQ